MTGKVGVVTDMVRAGLGWPEVELLVKEWLQYRDYADLSAYQATYTVKRFVQWLEGNPGHLGPVQYREYLQKKGLSRVYIAAQFSLLRSFWAYLVSVGKASHNPFGVITVRVGERRPANALTDEQVARLLSVLPEVGIRRRAIVSILLGTGIRIRALSWACINDVDTTTSPSRLWVRHKGHRLADAYVLLYPFAMQPLAEYLAERPTSDSDALFLSQHRPYNRLGYHATYYDVKAVFRRADIAAVPHVLRHTAITLARQHGASLDAVRQMAGHIDIKTTQVYDHSIHRLQNPPEQIIDNFLGRLAAVPG